MTTVDAVMVRLDADASALRAELQSAGTAAERDAARMGEAFQASAGAIDRAFGGTFGRLRRQVAALDFDVRGLLRGLLGDLAIGFAGLGIDTLIGTAFAGLAAPAPRPAPQAASGGRALNVTVVQNFALGVAPTVRAELAAMLPAIRRDVTAAVVDAQRRSGGTLI